MELKINSQASIKLEKVNTITEINVTTLSNQLLGDTLNGFVFVEGKYIVDDLDNPIKFSENIPYSVVLNNSSYEIEEIVCDNLSYQVIVGNSVDCVFDIIIKYKFKKEDSKDEVFIEDNNTIEEETQETEEIITENNIFCEEEFQDYKENIIEKNEEDPVTIEEDLKDDITKKYDELLKQVLTSREDNFFEETENNVVVSGDNNSPNKRNIYDGFRECYSSYHVYYLNDEKDIEEISKKENVSIDKIYKDNKDNNFKENKRIIIK